MIPSLINKDMYEPSYNDLKFSLKLWLCLHQSNIYGFWNSVLVVA